MECSSLQLRAFRSASVIGLRGAPFGASLMPVWGLCDPASPPVRVALAGPPPSCYAFARIRPAKFKAFELAAVGTPEPSLHLQSWQLLGACTSDRRHAGGGLEGDDGILKSWDLASV